MTKYFNDWQTEIRDLTSPEKEQQEEALQVALELHEEVETTQNALSPRKSTVESGERRIGTTATGHEYKKLRDRMVILAQRMAQRTGGDETDLPPTIYPPFVDGVRARDAKVHYLQKTSPRGEESDSHRKGNPLGYSAGLYRAPDWTLRMHLIPAPVGGLASGSNLVPAPLRVNNEFKTDIEHPADSARKPDGKMIWYETQVRFHPSPNEYFPTSISARYGTYRKTGSGWKERGAIKSLKESNIPLPRGMNWQLRINDPKESAKLYKEQTGATDNLIKAVKDLARDRPFKSVTEVQQRLDHREGKGEDDRGNSPKTKRGRPLADYTDFIQALRRLEAESPSRLTFK